MKKEYEKATKQGHETRNIGKNKPENGEKRGKS